MDTSLKLIQFEDKYYEPLYKIYGEQSERLGVLPHKQYTTFEQFKENFRKHIEGKYTVFKIVRDDRYDFIGFLIAYDYSRNDAQLKVSVYILPQFRALYGFLAVARFIGDLFRYFNLNKIFTEVYEFNEESIRMHEVFGFRREAVLQEYKYYDGKYYAMHIFSIGRDDFYDRIQKLGIGRG